jgi:hypothetical protein
VGTSLDPGYDRARLAVLYLLGDRGDAIAREARTREGEALAEALSNSDRGERAAALAGEIRRITRAMDDMSL